MTVGLFLPPAPPKLKQLTDDLHVDGVSHLHVSHLHQSGEVHLLLHLPVAPHLHRGVSGLQLSLGGAGGVNHMTVQLPSYGAEQRKQNQPTTAQLLQLVFSD